MNKGISNILGVIIVAIILMGGIGGYMYLKNKQVEPIACTMDAKQCPDGSYVSRIPPRCEFAECVNKPLDKTNNIIMQCSSRRELGGDYPICSENFREECTKNNGFVREIPMHFGGPNSIFECKIKAYDAGKKCASDNDCTEGCNFKRAIDSITCTLISKKNLIEEKSNSFAKSTDFYIATYLCLTDKPGICSDGVEDIYERIYMTGNAPGMRVSYTMKNYILTERRESGPIY